MPKDICTSSEKAERDAPLGTDYECTLCLESAEICNYTTELHEK